MNWIQLSRVACAGNGIDRGSALAVLGSSDDELLAVLDAAFRVRRQRFGRGVTLHVLRNARSGACSEDCAFCSQSADSAAGIPLYPLQQTPEIVQGALAAHKLGAARYCIVTSGRSPSESDVAAIVAATRQIKQSVDIAVCVSLGLLDQRQAATLKQAGVDRCNHNLETSLSFFPRICSTHTYAERLATTRAAKAAGLELCSGGIIGMGESLDDRVDLALALRDAGADSIPVNLFNPREGTALANRPRTSPGDALRALAMFRLVNPHSEIRIAGGREAILGPMQVLALYAADSMFTCDYLTTPGQGYQADIAMLAAAGFTVAGIIA